MPFILALDQGTTSSRAILFDHQGAICGVAQQEFEQIFPEPGQVEHDPRAIWGTQHQVMHQVMQEQRLTASDIVAIGITNQRETTVVWDRHSGEPVYNAIVWQDRRTAAECQRLHEAGRSGWIRQRTGLVLDAYFSGTKIGWILDHVPGARQRAVAGDLLFGTVDTWLTWNLTEGQTHITDASNASRTLLFNIHTGDWDDELLELFQIPRGMLPRVCDSSEVVARTARSVAGGSIPIAGIAGDQQAALFGQRCTTSGMVKCTYGTGCFLLMNTGQQAVDSQNRLLTTVAWRLDNRITYALEGSVYIGGAVVQWLRDGLGFFRTADEIEELAASVEDSDGVYLVPALSGLGAPHWDPWARGLIGGLTRGTTRAHIARAALEGIAWQVADLLHAMHGDSGIDPAELRADGGASANNLLLQFQSDIVNLTVNRPRVLETTARGVAWLAGLATGFWDAPAAIDQQWQSARLFRPQMSAQRQRSLRAGWDKALKRSLHWQDPPDNPDS